MNDNKFGHDVHSTGFRTSNSGVGTSSFNSNPAAATATGSMLGGLGELLNKVGIGPATISSMRDSMGNLQMGDRVTKARGYANANPGKVLGGLAALVIGAGMLRGRGMR